MKNWIFLLRGVGNEFLGGPHVYNSRITGNLNLMQSLKSLTREESEEFNRIRFTQNGIDDRTYQQALKYFLEYKNNSSNIPSDKLPIVLKSALFMSEKSQYGTNTKGERTAMPSLSLNQLLKMHQLEEVMMTLKDMSRSIKVNDKEALAELTNLIKEISFLITIHKKFEKTADRLELKERHPETGNQYIKQWTYYSWLLYALTKNHVLGKSLDLLENTCIMANTFAFMLAFSWQFIVPTGILKSQKRINEHSSTKEVTPILRERVLEMFSIKTMDIYASVATAFEIYFDKELASRGIVKNSPHSTDFLSPELMNQNYRRLDKHYERSMNVNDLDERIFFKERSINLTPSKFTPFARQGYTNKGKRDNLMKENFSSHRILNYEMMDKPDGNFKMTTDTLMSKLPKVVMVSPSTMKVPLIQATPVTRGLQLINYVNGKCQIFQEMLSLNQIIQRNHDASVIRYIEIMQQKFSKNSQKRSANIKVFKEEMIYPFFKLVLEEYLSKHSQDKDNEECFKAFMMMSIEIALFSSNSHLTYEDLQNQMDVTAIELWKACDFLIKFDRVMPHPLKVHLLDIEVTLISQKLWREKENIEMIVRFANGEKESNAVRSDLSERIFKRFLHQTAYQIQNLGSHLKHTDQIIESVYEIMKHIYCECPKILHSRHIDQLIICSFFVMSKKQKLTTKFLDIVEAYRSVNEHTKQTHEDIFRVIDGKEQISLIVYYNKIFVKELKDFIMGTRLNEVEGRKNYANNPVLMSPLKEIVPRDNNLKNRKVKNTSNLLNSLNQSPMLKQEAASFRGHALQSKKVINFDEEQQNLMKRPEEDKSREQEKVSPRNVSAIERKSSAQSGFPWKQQPQQPTTSARLTPTNVKSNPVPNSELTQFSTNPPPPQPKVLPPKSTTQGQYLMNLGKGRMFHQ